MIHIRERVSHFGGCVADVTAIHHGRRARIVIERGRDARHQTAVIGCICAGAAVLSAPALHKVVVQDGAAVIVTQT